MYDIIFQHEIMSIVMHMLCHAYNWETVFRNYFNIIADQIEIFVAVITIVKT